MIVQTEERKHLYGGQSVVVLIVAESDIVQQFGIRCYGRTVDSNGCPRGRMGCPVPEVFLRHRDVLSQLLHQQIAGVFRHSFLIRNGMANLPFLDPADRLIGICHPEPCNGDNLLGSPFIGGTENIFINTGFPADPFKDIGNADCFAECCDSTGFGRLPGACRKKFRSVWGFLSKQPAGYMLVVSLFRIVERSYFINVYVTVCLAAFDELGFGLA